MKDLRDQVWWTAAERAEFDVFVHELADAVFEHREAGCDLCASGYPPCPFVRATIERVIAWREDRILRSKATWLRSRQDRLDKAAEARGRIA